MPHQFMEKIMLYYIVKIYVDHEDCVALIMNAHVFHNITVFKVIFNQINLALVCIRDIFQKK